MKILLYAWYGLRSILLRGPLHTLRLLRYERVRECELDLRTSGLRAQELHGLHHYQGAPYAPLETILGAIYPETKDSHFVDIGCGMGRVLAVAALEGYTRLTGIELNASLLQVAEENMRRIASRAPGARITLVNADARGFGYPDGDSLYFMFNPFGEAVMEEVLDTIANCTNGRIWVVYMNPRFRKPFYARGFKVKRTFKTGFYTEAVVFVK